MKFILNVLLISILFSLNNYTLPQNSSSIRLKNGAMVLMNSGRYGEAIDQWNKYIAENPQSADAFNFRGFCYEKRGNYEFAIYDYRTAKKLAPSDKEIISNLNRCTNDWYKLLYNQIEGYKREIAINPNLAKNYLEIGKCYKNLGEWTEAEVWYDSYLEKAEASADEILRYTEILAKNNHISKGEPILKSFTEKYPTDHRLWSRYGYFLMWLGKNKSAIQSFTIALEIRPYFKEALDGLDLAKGKGYIYSINDTTYRFNYGLCSGGKVYAIDRYYRTIKNNPTDDETRFKLIDELIKANRFEEAHQQLVFLSFKYSTEKRFIDLWTKVETLKKSYYSNRIKYFEELLGKNSDNKKALLELGKFYSYNDNYDLALQIYINYLLKHPKDTEVRFKIVQLLTWQNDLCEAQKEVALLLQLESENKDYQLLAAKINLWLDKNLSESEKLYQKVLEKDPSNIESLQGLIIVKLKTENYSEAKSLITKLESIDNNLPEIPQLKNNLELLGKRIEDKKRFEILDEAKKLTSEGDYDKALEFFNQYMSLVGADKNVSMEMADVYLKKSDFNSAIAIYNEQLQSNYDYDIDKQRAKVLFWEGDSISALMNFKELTQKNPLDIEAKLFLGDAYLKTGQTQNAKKIYEDLLVQSPNSHILNTRLRWLGGSDKFFVGGNFPTYVQMIPQGYYFTDNTNFRLNNYGIGLDFGLTNSVAIGISGSRGNLFSSDEQLRFNQVKGSGYLKFSEIISATASFGQTYFTNDKQESLIDFSLTAKRKNNYTVSAFLNYSDAAFILYSPFLVSTRLNAYYYEINADYKFKNKFVVIGKYAHIDILDNNKANQFQARIGKMFESDLTAGYEYYYYSFDNYTPIYWSPKNFESHSLWADWILFQDQTTSFMLGGKVGLIPQNDYVLSEFYASFSYQFSTSISLNAKLTTGSSSRSNIGYRATSFQGGLYWNL
jgi:tetratricopeptide (TPR) repeat protein